MSLLHHRTIFVHIIINIVRLLKKLSFVEKGTIAKLIIYDRINKTMSKMGSILQQNYILCPCYIIRQRQFFPCISYMDIDLGLKCMCLGVEN